MPFNISWARASAAVSDHAGNAAYAASIAARASFSLPFGAESTTSPVAGLITSYVCPELEAVNSPAMNIFAMRPPLEIRGRSPKSPKFGVGHLSYQFDVPDPEFR